MAKFPVSASQVQLSSTTPLATDAYDQGLLRDAGDTVVRAATAGGAQFSNGLLLTSLGQIIYVDATAGLPANTQYNNGIPMSSAGAMCISTGPAASWRAGLPYAANGAVSALVDGAFNPASLFASGEPGAWYDPSNFATMWQDNARTTPVTAVGQPVGAINDLSGRGNHATQSTTTSRPILQQDGGGRYYLAFDGVDDFMVTGSIDFTATAQMTVFAGVLKADDTTTRVVVELSPSTASNNGSFYLSAPNLASPNNFFTMRPNGTTPSSASSIAYTAPTTAVLTGAADIAAPMTSIRVNQTQTNSAGSLGAGTFGNYPIFVGMRGGVSLPFKGSLYSLIVRGAASSAGQVTSTEAYCNSKTGAF